MKKLTDFVHWKANIWASESKVLERTNHTVIFSGVLYTKTITICQTELLGCSQWGIDKFAVVHACPG
jgi:hypothetical protein